MNNTIEKLKDFYIEKKFLLDCIMLTVLFFINCFTSYGAYFAFTLLFALVLLSDLKKSISYVFFCIGFCYLTHVSGIVLLMVCLLTYIVKIVYIKYFQEKRKIDKKTIIMLSILLIYLIFPFKNFYNANMLVKILAIYAVFILVYLLINFPEEFRLKFNLNIIALSLFIASLFSLLVFVSPYIKQNFPIIYTEEDYIRFCAFFLNPNVLAMICEMVLSLLAYFILSKNYSYKEIISFVILSLLGLLTFSKAFLIIFCIILAFMFFWNAKRISLRGWIILGILVSMSVIVAVIKFDVLLSYIKRFMRLDTTGIGAEQFANILTTSRWDLWVNYFKYLLENPLVIIFGRGLGAPIISVNSTHNMYLSMIYQMGVVGTALYIASFVFMLKTAPKREQKFLSKAVVLPIIVFALLCLEEDLIFFIY